MIQAPRRIPLLAAAGVAVILGGAGLDVVLHLDSGRGVAAQFAHVVVLAGMVITLAGVLLDAYLPNKEGR